MLQVAAKGVFGGITKFIAFVDAFEILIYCHLKGFSDCKAKIIFYVLDVFLFWRFLGNKRTGTDYQLKGRDHFTKLSAYSGRDRFAKLQIRASWILWKYLEISRNRLMQLCIQIDVSNFRENLCSSDRKECIWPYEVRSRNGI